MNILMHARITVSYIERIKRMMIFAQPVRLHDGRVRNLVCINKEGNNESNALQNIAILPR
jgi:hypothetical protein